MTKESYPYFNSKILLFGEYSLMVGSKALSISSDKYRGRLNFAKPSTLQGAQIQSNHALYNFFLNLKKLAKSGLLKVSFNFDHLSEDLTNGLFFDSNIPQGYGLGSSGALVAAVYEEYGIGTKKRNQVFSNAEISLLKKDFSVMESFFHGKSSGLDPLICFLQKPVLVENSNRIKIIDIHKPKPGGNTALFLFDTNSTGETQPLVNYFIKQCDNKQYLDGIRNELIPLNETCINAFLNGDIKSLKEGMKMLSTFTLNHFSPMVPKQIRAVWKSGLDSDTFFLKLCGSGGGGMMLGYTDDFEKIQSKVKTFKTEQVYRF